MGRTGWVVYQYNIGPDAYNTNTDAELHFQSVSNTTGQISMLFGGGWG